MCGGGNPINSIVDSAVNHVENVGKGYAKDPERAALGINTSYEGDVWKNITGKDYDPLVGDLATQGSAYTATDKKTAAQKGISSGPQEAVDSIAQALSLYFGGTALASAAGAGAAGAGGEAFDPALAGGGEVGSGYASSAPGVSGVSMPAAAAESSGALASQGLVETSPGVWEQAGAGMGGGAAQALGLPQQSPQMPPAQAEPPGGPTAPGGSAAQPSMPAASPAGAHSTPGGQPAPGQSGSTGDGIVDKILQQMKNNPLATAGTAMMGVNMLNAGKQGGQAQQATQQQQQLSGEAQATAQQLLGQYRSGQLSAGQQSSLDQVTQNTRNQLNQYFASIGQSDSTAAKQALAQVDQQALAMKQQMLDSALQQGLQAIGIASGPLNSVVNYQLGQDKALRDAFGAFAGSLGNIAGRQAGSTPTNQTPTQPAPATGQLQVPAGQEGSPTA